MRITTAPDGPGYPAKLPDLLFFICFYLLYRILSLIRVEVNHVGFALAEMPSGISFRISPRAAWGAFDHLQLPDHACRHAQKRQRLRISGCAVYKMEMKLKQSSGNYDSAILITANLITANLITANLITARVCLLNVRLL